ncbi:MAG: hypothetical protein ACRDY7_17515 [Acidimicrobiia bacterium]
MLIPKTVQDAGYTAVGLAVLAVGQVYARRQAIKARFDAVAGEVWSVAEPLARTAGIPRLADPVCGVASGGRTLLDQVIRRR